MHINDSFTLNNDIEIPILGYGTFQTPDDESGVEAIVHAIQTGYRHIDTAQSYKNEESVGQALQLAGVPRAELFLTTKIANAIGDYDGTLRSIEDSLQKLGTDYIDLVLIHWPAPLRFRDHWVERNREVWRALEHCYTQGKIKALGVSNFKSRHLLELLKTTTVKPAVNQIRLCPGDVDTQTVATCRAHGMLLEAYSPLAQGLIFEVDDIHELAAKYQKNPAQIALRWSLQMGFLPLPKSVTVERMRANRDIFDFELDSSDMALLAGIIGQCGLAKDPDSVPF